MATRQFSAQQRDQLRKFVERYIEEQSRAQELFVGTAYAHGRDQIAELAGADIIRTALDERRLADIVRTNVDRITGQAGDLREEIFGLVEDFYSRGAAPGELEAKLRTTFGVVENSWRNIARDQVAKAQLEGRNATYAELNWEFVEVTCAPDACEECNPYDGEIVNVVDDASRPQYHIQCACMDVPVPPEDASPTEPADLADDASQSDDAGHDSNRDNSEE